MFFIVQLSDALGRLVAVNAGHLDVHEDHVVIRPVGSRDHHDRGLAVFRGLHRVPDVLEELLGDLPVEFIVLHEQDPYRTAAGSAEIGPAFRENSRLRDQAAPVFLRFCLLRLHCFTADIAPVVLS